MAVTYSAATKTARMQAVADEIDAGSGAGEIKIYDASNNLLVAIPLADPCGVAAAGVLTFTAGAGLSAGGTAAGDAAGATITDSDDVVVISGLTVGTSSADIVVDSVAVRVGRLVTVLSGTITHA
jgi:hypothetical protein